MSEKREKKDDEEEAEDENKQQEIKIEEQKQKKTFCQNARAVKIVKKMAAKGIRKIEVGQASSWQEKRRHDNIVAVAEMSTVVGCGQVAEWADVRASVNFCFFFF